MTTMETRPLLDTLGVFGTPATGTARAVGKPRPARRQRLVAWVRRHASETRTTIVAVAGLGPMVAAAYTWQLWAGLVASGIAVLLIDHAADAANPPTQP